MKYCRHPKRKPYGTTGTDPYCIPHDSCRTYTVKSRAVRQRAKREIERNLKRDKIETDHQIEVLVKMREDYEQD